MALKTYNCKDVSVIVGARVLTGFAEDSKVVLARTSDAFTSVVGTDGEVTRAKSNDKRGTITISLMQSSDDNDFLSALANADELSGAGVTNVLVKDNSGRALHSAPEAWVQKQPDCEYNREAGSREWILECAQLNNTIGGN